MVLGRERVELKTLEQVRVMRRAGLVVADVLAAVSAAARPGVTTADLDDVARGVIAAGGATSSFLGYHGFPATICTSVNDEVIHGIPGPRVLQAGDVVSVDAGAVVDGWHGDSATTFVLGADGALPPGSPEADADDDALVRATEAAMWAGIAALAPKGRLNDVGRAVETAVEIASAASGVPFGIVEEYVGHGIGSAMHQPPDVLNYATSGRGQALKTGMCLAVEPMVTRGSGATRELADGWTVVTTDGSRSAHWEHSVAILADGITVLTAPDGGAERLAALGVDVIRLD
ncbi:methionine aminopeptidase, type I [Xylanimonas cellulosilytica DSM 15894]|uniref:Methionine aminopeptidase n=1 Tax=Xylanimonas cellulosilytica (strain DSM 15894 / JCM 12276 / CECT 5975 / KCTC 9989 / LMG 20990 / NBRC 107835 / XIL07) TaxID=446471 RepID=D1BWV6_XYLCX|nr:type I methionyl aminopeptidase [Xylanimonas cellulosilytica]ACZ29688.1 methionine aminopeptidase, type I [Xylanimonas cellulosilytica DSM 15894]